jgi:hypothetical protein
MRTLFIFLYLAIVSFQLKAQETFPVNGVQDTRGKLVVFTHANIVISGDSILRNANLIIQDGKILAIGTTAKFPANAVINDVKGNYIYPTFIDLYSDYGIAKPAKTDRGNYEQMLSKKKGAYDWNQAVHPETNAAELFVKDGAVAKHLRQCGFGAVLTHQADGIVRGSGCVVSLTDESEQKALLQAEVTHR